MALTIFEGKNCVRCRKRIKRSFHVLEGKFYCWPCGLSKVPRRG